MIQKQASFAVPCCSGKKFEKTHHCALLGFLSKNLAFEDPSSKKLHDQTDINVCTNKFEKLMTVIQQNFIGLKAYSVCKK